ncbi:hypothetical protein J6590_096131 [Homalodisca vitripennis]|nr:hypothetical protein J6590_096131 [Homalodisca vitripennis]
MTMLQETGEKISWTAAMAKVVHTMDYRKKVMWTLVSENRASAGRDTETKDPAIEIMVNRNTPENQTNDAATGNVVNRIHRRVVAERASVTLMQRYRDQRRSDRKHAERASVTLMQTETKDPAIGIMVNRIHRRIVAKGLCDMMQIHRRVVAERASVTLMQRYRDQRRSDRKHVIRGAVTVAQDRTEADRETVTRDAEID